MLGNLRGMVVVPRVMPGVYPVVASMWLRTTSETAVNCDFAAFGFVFRDVRRKMRHNIPQVHNAITHVYVL